MVRKIVYGLIALLVALGIGAYLLGDRVDRADRAQTVSTLFTGAEQIESFPRFYKMFPSKRMEPAPQPRPFARTERQIALPESFISYKGEAFNTEDFLSLTDTAAVLVLKDGVIIHEHYRATGGAGVQWMSMSMAKSFVSALIGIAVGEGLIESIEQPITDYVPELIGSAYDGVRIKDVLQMSSGARWNEDYNDPESDINRFGRIFALGGSLDEFAATLTGEREPGTFNQYNSTDTHALGMMLVRATGRSITDYMVEKLYHPMGAEDTGYWLTDSEGMEMVGAGLNLTARDYAKLGELYRAGGRLHGRQIVPADWVAASVTPDAPHLVPGANNPSSDSSRGYGYQWWIPYAGMNDFNAAGVYNQFIYVSPDSGMTIVKLSANSHFGTTPDRSTDYMLETTDLMRAIIDANE